MAYFEVAFRFMESLLAKFRTYQVKEGVSLSYQKKCQTLLRQFFREFLISEIKGINCPVVEAWIVKLRERGCHDGYITNHLWAIRNFLKFCDSQKLHCWKFDIPIKPHKPPEAAEIEFLEKDELEKLMRATGTDDLMRTLMLTITLTGLRPSEALGLKRHEIGGDELEITGKGSKKRTIYFIPELLSAIRYLLSTHSDSRVFPIPLRTAEYRFQGYRKRAKLTRHVVLHDLRHTYATNLLLSEKRVPAELIAVLLGHSDVKVTRKYYLAVRQKDAKAMHFQALSKQPETKFANSERRFLV